MKGSKKDVELAVLNVAEVLEIKSSIEKLLSINGLYETIKIVAYEVFVQKYLYYFEDNDLVFDSYLTIVEYSREMKQKGHVNFNE